MTFFGAPIASKGRAALRERTREAHDEIERALALASPSAGREEYARHVAALWGWMKPVEPRLWRAPWPASVDTVARAMMTSWLETDIAAARADGLLGSQIEVSDPVKPGSRAARFGQAYVIEGSMLGGAMLLRRLGPRLAPWPVRYLHGYGAEAARYWREFLAALDESVSAPGDVDEAADAADETFCSIGRWLRAHGASR
jgi:heme oxygenase (biliverdin-IX-beta and delta-forming)